MCWDIHNIAYGYVLCISYFDYLEIIMICGIYFRRWSRIYLWHMKWEWEFLG